MRKLTLDELKIIMSEEFRDMVPANKIKAKQQVPWNDAELEHDVNWIRALGLKEFFRPKQ